MGTPAGCAACVDDFRAQCRGALARAGVLKAHWECWTECNLHCEFCFRSRDGVLGTVEAKRLLEILRFGGARQVVLSGGDPSLRPDLLELVRHAHDSCGLAIEIQTNAHFQSAMVRLALRQADLVGLSIDGATPAAHDSFRNKKNNLSRVLSLLAYLAEGDRRATVRTIVSRQNLHHVGDIGRLLTSYGNLVRWSLMQFSPIEDGYANRLKYEVEEAEFWTAVRTARGAYEGPAEVDAFPNTLKPGTYFLLTSAGNVFGRTGAPLGGRHPVVGNIFASHLEELARETHFDAHRHRTRYATLIGPPSDPPR